MITSFGKAIPLLLAAMSAACTTFQGDPGQPVLFAPVTTNDAGAGALDAALVVDVAPVPDIGKPDIVPDIAKPDVLPDTAKPDIAPDIAKPDIAPDIAKPDVVALCAPDSCDDGNSCTFDACYPKTGCYYTPINGAVCNADNPCFAGVCSNSQCVGKTNCDDGKSCTLDSCSNGNCQHEVQCDDGLACTADVCQSSGCVHSVSCPGGTGCDMSTGICLAGAGGCSGASSAAYLASDKASLDFPDTQNVCTFQTDCLAKTGADAQQACIATCIASYTPLEPSCAACYGAYDWCMWDKCTSSCAQGKFAGAVCAACKAANCDAALQACAGLP